MTEAASVWDLMGPARCLGCGAARGLLCGACREELRPPIEGGPIPDIDRCVVAWQYEGAARALVLALKLRAVRPAAVPLADGLHRAVARTGLAAGVLTWVPGRGADVRHRGFDHAGLLARTLGARLGLPVRRLLLPTGDRPDQTGLGAAGRWANLRGAFRARPCTGPVAVVDDVVTTGATAGSCALALRRAGATRVEILAACRA